MNLIHKNHTINAKVFSEKKYKYFIAAGILTSALTSAAHMIYSLNAIPAIPYELIRATELEQTLDDYLAKKDVLINNLTLSRQNNDEFAVIDYTIQLEALMQDIKDTNSMIDQNMAAPSIVQYESDYANHSLYTKLGIPLPAITFYLSLIPAQRRAKQLEKELQ